MSETATTRIRFSLSRKVSTGDYGSEGWEYSIETQVPNGPEGAVRKEEVKREVQEELVLWLESLRKRQQPTPSTPQLPLEPTPELDPAYLDGLGWKHFVSGGGEWIFADTPGLKALREELARTGGTAVIDKYRYRVTQGRDREFINRFPAEAAKR